MFGPVIDFEDREFGLAKRKLENKDSFQRCTSLGFYALIYVYASHHHANSKRKHHKTSSQMEVFDSAKLPSLVDLYHKHPKNQTTLARQPTKLP